MIIPTQRAFRSLAAFALALPLAGFWALSAQAGAKSPPPTYDVTFDNVSTEFLSAKVRLPKVEIKGSNIAKADIEKLFSSEAATPFGDRVKTFSAASVTIPAIEIEFAFGPVQGKVSYQGIVVEGINGGRIARTAVASTTAQISVKDISSADIIAKPMILNDLDLAQAFRIWSDKAGPDDGDLKGLWGSGSMDGFSMRSTSPTGAGTAEYGKVTIISGPKVRPLSRPMKEIFNDAVALVQAFSDKSVNPDPATKAEQLRKLQTTLSGVVEFAENYQPDSYTLDGYKAEELVANLIKVTVNIARMEAGPKGLKLDGIAISGLDGNIGIGGFSLDGFSLEPTIAAAKVFLAKPLESYTESDFQMLARKLQPNWGTFNFRDVDIDVTVPKGATDTDKDEEEEESEEATPAPAPEQPAAQMENIKFRVGDVTLKLEKPFNGIPTALRIAISNLQVPVSMILIKDDTWTRQLPQQLQAIGYSDANLSYAVDMSWNRDANELTINEIKFGDETLGSFVLGGTIGNFTPDMFSGNLNLIQASAISLLAKNVSLRVEDKGVLDRVAKIKAGELGLTPEQWKASLSQMMMLIPPDLTELNSVRVLTKAILDFWNKPGTLDISVRAKNGAGLGLADFIALTQVPTSIDPKIEVKAEAK